MRELWQNSKKIGERNAASNVSIISLSMKGRNILVQYH